MGVLIFLLIILFVPFSLLLFVGGLGAMVGGEILSILLLPIALIVVFIVPPVIIIWGMNVVFRIKGSFVRRIEKKTLSDRFEQLKTPGNTLVLGGCPWKVVAVEGGKALIICMKAGKIRGMKVNRPQYPINFISYVEHIFLQMAHPKITDRLLERPDTAPKLARPKGKESTGYFFLLTEDEVGRYFGGIQQAAKFLKESNEPYYVDQCDGYTIPEGAKYLMFARADGKRGFYHVAMRIKI